MKDFNNFKSKFTSECDRNSIKFLEPNVKLNNGVFTTSVYIKPADRYQYLNYRSSHLDYIKRSIVYRQTLWAAYVNLKKIIENEMRKK